jgi:poly(hydroxyalkanoate) depolymerase family esterase
MPGILKALKNMSLKIPAGLLDATRLVRGGKLMDATAAIQRALGLNESHAQASPDPRSSTLPDHAVIEGYCRVVDPQRAHRHDAGAARERSQSDRPAPGKGARFENRFFSNEAGTRSYKLYVPSAYDGQALPLVVMLHGCTQSPDDFAAGTRMNALAEEHGFVVVYPAQAKEANVSRCWNWFQGGDQQRDRGEPSLIAGITREVLGELHLDATRVYAAGLSAGGAMAAILGTTYPDLYAAIGVHSGLAYAAASDMPSAFAAMSGHGLPGLNARAGGSAPEGRVLPTIVFHGDSDTTVHPKNGEHVLVKVPASERSQRATGEHTVEIESGEASGRSYTRTAHLDAGGKPVMEHWLVHGAGHAWCGGSSEGSFTDGKGPDASREMLRFFLQHVRR